MVIAYLVVRRRFSGKDALDFASNLGGAVPGTILGIGFVLAFSTVPTFVIGVLYVLLAAQATTQDTRVLQETECLLTFPILPCTIKVRR